METLEYRWVDKSKWGPGEWQQEPDKIQWPDEITGLPCLIVRGPSGALCGYVGLPPGHPLHGCPDEESLEVAVHGGLTYADACQHDSEGQGICHVPGPGEPEDVFWLGFDCAHAGDLCPAHSEFGQIRRKIPRGETYRNVTYVRVEVTRLASQLAAMGS